MPGKRPAIWAVLCVLALVLAYATSAGAEDTKRAQRAAEGGTPAGSRREAVLEARVEEQAAAGYLQDGGAPQDWYVKKVLAVAEVYRRTTKASGHTFRAAFRKE